MEKNLCFIKVQIKWAKREWHMLNSQGHHIQEFDSGLFESYFEKTSKEEVLWFGILITKTLEEKANIKFVWNEEENRWSLFDLKSGLLVKNLFACDKIPHVFPAAVKDRPNYYKFYSKLIKTKEEPELSRSYNVLTGLNFSI